MSVLVKGMKMPSNCAHCICASEDARYCAAANEYIPMLGKPDFCPLVALPDKHGRLVDADEMLKRLQAWNTSDRMDKAFYNFAWNRIMEQPTIVEAEDSE